MWSWLLHRVAGLGLLIFLFIHIVDISVISFGPTVYNNSVRLFDGFIARFLSLGLVAFVLYHALNGLRIMAIDFWSKGVLYQKLLFVAVLAMSILVFIPIAYIIMLPVVQGWLHLPTASASN
jgi:succinate dehydrogenase / fumarate reductase cytochrome b subunit